MVCLLTAIVAIVVIYYVVSWTLSRLRVGDFSNKYVLITGCDSGFGNLLTKRLDRLGFNVFAACLTSAGAEKLQGACSDRVTTLLLDVRDEKSIAAARHLVEGRLPTGRGLWGLVNNAGIAGIPGPSEWLTKDDWSNVLSINLMGLINMTQAFLPLVRVAKGRVVNVASIMGRIAAASAPYCVSKYGVEAYSDCLRREVYSQGVKVCILEPGFFKTEILSAPALVNSFRSRFDTTPEDVRKHYPMFTAEKFPKLIQQVRDNGSDNVELVIDAHEIALTSRFPPTRQMLGYDANFFFRLLWNLPTPLTDWILLSQLKRGLK